MYHIAYTPSATPLMARLILVRAPQEFGGQSSRTAQEPHSKRYRSYSSRFTHRPHSVRHLNRYEVLVPIWCPNFEVFMTCT